MKNKILIIGPSSTHVDRFIGLVISNYDDVVYVGESELETNYSIRQHIVNFRTSNPFVIRSGSKKLRRIIEAENPNHIHIQQVNRVAFLASGVLKSRNRKFVVTAWGSDVLVIPKKNFFFRWMTKAVLKRAAYVTADSLDMMEAIRKLAPNQKAELVLLGITPIGSLPKEKIIYSNRALFPLYNIEKIIDEFTVFSKSHPDWKLVIAGTGPCEADLKQRVKNAGIESMVEFCGWLKQEENYANYRRAAIYISLPSSDGTSVSLLESMSAGCIPVLSDLPVSHEWVQNKVNGIIKSTSENALVSALELNQQEVALQNERLIHQRATTAIASQKFHAIYQQITRA